MKTIWLLVGIIAATPWVTLHGQDTAPTSIAGKTAIAVISSGSGIFAAIGGYRISFSQTNATYTVSPLNATVPPSAGTYSYAKTNSNIARLTVTDSASGRAIAQDLVFTSSNSASYSLSNAVGAQTGTLVFENLLNASPTGGGVQNVSVRAQVLAGAQVISGVVIDSPCRVLIRVAGPALIGFGVNGTLSNPKVTLMKANKAITSNDDWANTISNHDAVSEAGSKSGAFPFTFGSKDAGLVADLSVGEYTCVISGDAGTSGEVLLEIYRVPQ